MKIDFVITWVDPSDPQWQQQKSKYKPDKGADESSKRYRDWDNLKYWFRGIEQNAPWVNKIYFVTYGHVPKWLNLKHPKLQIVKHTDFIPKEYLPTFNSNSIELNLFRIKGLSEKFVFFNDDFFLINRTEPTDFFKHGEPCGAACLNVNTPSGDIMDGIIANNIAIINQHFKLRSVVGRNISKWLNLKNKQYLYGNFALLPYGNFAGIRPEHLPASIVKSTYKKLWQLEPEKFHATCLNKFRSPTDINHWLMKYWQICEGNFTPRNVNWGKYYEYGQGLPVLQKILRSKKYKTVCLNDTAPDQDFIAAKNFTNRCLLEKFPQRSQFELEEK